MAWPQPREARLGDPQGRRPGQVPGVLRPTGPQFSRERLVSWGCSRALSLAAGLPAVGKAYRLAQVLTYPGPPGPQDSARFSLSALAQLLSPLLAEAPGLG